MDLITLSSDFKSRYCKLIFSSVKNEFLLSIPFKTLQKLKSNISDFSRLELVCNPAKRTVFSPNQRSNIVVKTSFLSELTFFTYFFRTIDYNELNQSTEFETLLNSLTISFRCLEN